MPNERRRPTQDRCDDAASSGVFSYASFWLRVRAAGVRTRRHPGQPELLHQALYPFAIDEMTRRLEENHHLAAAIEGPPGIFFVNQAVEQKITFIDWLGMSLSIDRGA